MPISAAEDTLGGQEPTMVSLAGAARSSALPPATMASASNPVPIALLARVAYFIEQFLPGGDPCRRGEPSCGAPAVGSFLSG